MISLDPTIVTIRDRSTRGTTSRRMQSSAVAEGRWPAEVPQPEPSIPLGPEGDRDDGRLGRDRASAVTLLERKGTEAIAGEHDRIAAAVALRDRELSSDDVLPQLDAGPPIAGLGNRQ